MFRNAKEQFFTVYKNVFGGRNAQNWLQRIDTNKSYIWR